MVKPDYFSSWESTVFSYLWNFAHSHLVTWNPLFLQPTKFYSFLKIRWNDVSFVMSRCLMPLLPEPLLHFVLPMSKPSINSLRIGIVPYIWNWIKQINILIPASLLNSRDFWERKFPELQLPHLIIGYGIRMYTLKGSYENIWDDECKATRIILDT